MQIRNFTNSWGWKRFEQLWNIIHLNP